MNLSTPSLFILIAWSVAGLVAGLTYGAVLELGVRQTVERSRPGLMLALAPVRIGVVVAVLFFAAAWSGLGGLIPAILGFAVGSRFLRPPAPQA